MEFITGSSPNLQKMSQKTIKKHGVFGIFITPGKAINIVAALRPDYFTDDGNTVVCFFTETFFTAFLCSRYVFEKIWRPSPVETK